MKNVLEGLSPEDVISKIFVYSRNTALQNSIFELLVPLESLVMLALWYTNFGNFNLLRGTIFYYCLIYFTILACCLKLIYKFLFLKEHKID